jgi:hypothetical protein
MVKTPGFAYNYDMLRVDHNKGQLTKYPECKKKIQIKESVEKIFILLFGAVKNQAEKQTEQLNPKITLISVIGEGDTSTLQYDLEQWQKKTGPRCREKLKETSGFVVHE